MCSMFGLRNILLTRNAPKLPKAFGTRPLRTSIFPQSRPAFRKICHLSGCDSPRLHILLTAMSPIIRDLAMECLKLMKLSIYRCLYPSSPCLGVGAVCETHLAVGGGHFQPYDFFVRFSGPFGNKLFLQITPVTLRYAAVPLMPPDALDRAIRVERVEKGRKGGGPCEGAASIFVTHP